MISELDMQKVQTCAFIAASPVWIALTPRTRVLQANGAWKWVLGTVREPQRFRLIDTGAAAERGAGFQVGGDDGTQRVASVQLLAEVGQVVEVGDIFQHNGDWLEVIQIQPSNGYEIRADTTRLMQPPPQV